MELFLDLGRVLGNVTVKYILPKSLRFGIESDSDLAGIIGVVECALLLAAVLVIIVQVNE